MCGISAKISARTELLRAPREGDAEVALGELEGLGAEDVGELDVLGGIASVLCTFRAF